MSAGAAGATAAQVAQIANAVRAMGSIVQVEDKDFQILVNREENLLIVMHEYKKFGKTHFQYLMNYKGLTFYCRTKTQIQLSARHELVQAKKVWVPG